MGGELSSHALRRSIRVESNLAEVTVEGSFHAIANGGIHRHACSEL
jgi:hypothetical protein